MKSKYDELFSSLGYEALNVVIGINPCSISEEEVKRLINLIGLSENDPSLESEMENIIQKYSNNAEMKLRMLLHLEQRYTTNRKREDYE
ncbi:hypothetical protein B0I26_1025 [Anoxybacillus vitaminiphilus]|uniref:Uncharacterized protein n=1 Tax=Paranoxybacillus vitaminiphilus TaxID=581036 RepID=A0A327YP35_9BACL|nr:hypothetical protein [Anoxybacillus vitaminiphilus]RAK22027.1 hypothetical protein B0I26_1025 [Anoxybacillus vitaminiphilus]